MRAGKAFLLMKLSIISKRASSSTNLGVLDVGVFKSRPSRILMAAPNVIRARKALRSNIPYFRFVMTTAATHNGLAKKIIFGSERFFITEGVKSLTQRFNKELEITASSETLTLLILQPEVN